MNNKLKLIVPALAVLTRLVASRDARADEVYPQSPPPVYNGVQGGPVEAQPDEQDSQNNPQDVMPAAVPDSPPPEMMPYPQSNPAEAQQEATAQQANLAAYAPPAAPMQAAAPVPPGQWTYTTQYGWLWMPYDQGYTQVNPESDAAYSYVFYPSFGWRWVTAPWILGFGPRPYWGALGVSRFAWYSRPWFHYSAPYRGFGGQYYGGPRGGGYVGGGRAWGGGVGGGWARGRSGFGGGGRSFGGGGRSFGGVAARAPLTPPHFGAASSESHSAARRRSSSV